MNQLEKYRLLFLDIDGPLISEWSQLATGVKSNGRLSQIEAFDPSALAALRTICHGLNVGIVLSSSLRLDIANRKISLAEFRCLAKLPVFDCTPFLGETRGVEIQGYLDVYQELREGAEIEYVILDDHNDMLPKQFDRFVRVSSEAGLDLVSAEKICRRFGNSVFSAQSASKEKGMHDNWYHELAARY